MKGRVTVSLRTGVLDVEGKAIGKALTSLGFGDDVDVRVGRVFEIELPESSPEVALSRLKDMAVKLLSNPIMESYRLELVGSAPEAALGTTGT